MCNKIWSIYGRWHSRVILIKGHSTAWTAFPKSIKMIKPGILREQWQSSCRWFILFHFMLHWFIITGHDLHGYISFVTGSSLLGMLCIVSLNSSPVHSYWVWLVFFHCMLHWFISTGHGLYSFTSCLTGISLMCMICIVSLRVSLVHHYWAWFVLFHFPHWFIITANGLYCFSS